MSQPNPKSGLPVAPGEAYPDSQATAPTNLTHAASPVGEKDVPSPIATAGGVALAAYWCWAADPFALSGLMVLAGGLSFTLGILGFFAVALVLRKGQLRLSPQAIAALVLTGLLACVPAITTSVPVRFINAFVLAASCMASYRLLYGAAVNDVVSLGGLLRNLGMFVHSQFAHFGLPLRAIRRSGTHQGQRRAVVAGAAIAAAILLVVLPLLGEADPVFASLTSGATRLLTLDHLGLWAMRFARLALVALLACSLLHSLLFADASPAAPTQPKQAPAVRGATVATVLATLDVVYLAFAFIQVRYLFAASGSIPGGFTYATYARSGFFQLVAVASINLTVIALCLWTRSGARANRLIMGFELATLALTALMLASAALRMTLYVRAFGLTQLRALTYLAMVAIAVLTLLFAARVLRRDFPLAQLALASVAALWVVYALSCPDARIAWFNVDGYLSGDIATVDTTYLLDLSAEAEDAILALGERIPADDPHAQAAHDAADDVRFYRGASPAYDLTNWQAATVTELLAGR